MHKKKAAQCLSDIVLTMILSYEYEVQPESAPSFFRSAGAMRERNQDTYACQVKVCSILLQKTKRYISSYHSPNEAGERHRET